jgi:rhodanese-related sulfurtransferase
MSLKYAFLRNNYICLIDYIEEEEYANHIREWDSIINIDGTSPEPQVGWILEGNTLVPTSPEIQQRDQQAFGSGLALDLVNKMGTRNLLLASQGEVVNVSSLLTNVGAVKALIETGALKTARSLMQALAPAYPAYSDIFNYGASQITTFLSNRGWN